MGESPIMADPTGRILTEIRDAPAVAALCDRVRCPEPMGRQVNAAGVETDPGDARGPGKYVRFIVLVRLARSRLHQVPVQEVRYLARCYGLTAQDADQLAGAVRMALNDAGHRRTPAGVSIFSSFDEGDGGSVTDPDTGQPMTGVIVSVGASTSLIEAAPIG